MQVSTNVCDGPKTGLNEIKKKNRMAECQHNNMDKQKKTPIDFSVDCRRKN